MLKGKELCILSAFSRLQASQETLLLGELGEKGRLPCSHFVTFLSCSSQRRTIDAIINDIHIYISIYIYI